MIVIISVAADVKDEVTDPRIWTLRHCGRALRRAKNSKVDLYRCDTMRNSFSRINQNRYNAVDWISILVFVILFLPVASVFDNSFD